MACRNVGPNVLMWVAKSVAKTPLETTEASSNNIGKQWVRIRDGWVIHSWVVCRCHRGKVIRCASVARVLRCESLSCDFYAHRCAQSVESKVNSSGPLIGWNLAKTGWKPSWVTRIRFNRSTCGQRELTWGLRLSRCLGGALYACFDTILVLCHKVTRCTRLRPLPSGLFPVRDTLDGRPLQR